MRVAVGSTRRSKVDAAQRAFCRYFPDAEVFGVEVGSGVSEQPMSDEETIKGAIARARAAAEHGDFGVGIEAGLKPVPESLTGYLNTTWCAIMDSKGQASIGSSPDFEHPHDVIKGVKNGEIVSASAASVLKRDSESLREYGVIGELTKGAVTRTDYVSHSVMMALVPWLHKALYGLE